MNPFHKKSKIEKMGMRSRTVERVPEGRSRRVRPRGRA